MRAALIEAWPALSETFGIHPWDVPRLSVAEITVYLWALRQRADEYARAEAEARRRR